MLGTVRIRTHSAQPVFVGIGPAAAVDAYLAGVRREVATRFDAAKSDFRLHRGGAPAAAPATKHFWAAQTVGSAHPERCPGRRATATGGSIMDYRCREYSSGGGHERDSRQRDPELKLDAVIVGGSLPGCSTAILLGRAGARVAVVEKQPNPDAFKRMCTHFIQASAAPTIERLDLLDPIMEAGGVRFQDARLDSLGLEPIRGCTLQTYAAEPGTVSEQRLRELGEWVRTRAKLAAVEETPSA